MQAPLVSIIIPTYNRAHLIGETLDSVIAQTYTNWECIVVDDGSTDETDTLLKGYCEKDSRFQYHHRPLGRTKGANACRNYGFELCNGKYVNWFDSDDIMHPNRLMFHIDLMKGNKLNCVIGNFTYFKDNLNSMEVSAFNSFQKENLLRDAVAGSIILNLQSILWNKSLLNEIRFEESLSYAEDLEFIFNQMVSKKFAYEILEEVLVYIRKHNETLTRNFQKTRNETLINDEIKVRNIIWTKLVKQGYSTELTSGAFMMYLKSLKYLLYINQYSKFVKEIVKLFTVDKMITNLILIKLIVISYLFKFTGKGMSLYQRTINALKS